MPKQLCPTCNGTGWEIRKRGHIDRKGKTRTVENKETCRNCDGSGWVDL